MSSLPLATPGGVRGEECLNCQNGGGMQVRSEDQHPCTIRRFGFAQETK
jgi:hypothetical protein